MKAGWQRAAFGGVVTAAVATVGLLAPATAAQARDVTSASFTVSGDAGDHLTDGASFAYSAPGDDFSAITRNNQQIVWTTVTGADGHTWTLGLGRQDGQPLVPGSWTGTTMQWPGSGPYLSLQRDDRSCASGTGSFTVTNVAWGPNGWATDLDASFEFHCDGAAAASRGEVHFAGMAEPAPLQVSTSLAADGVVNAAGEAVLHGTVTCSEDASVSVEVSATQQAGGTSWGGRTTAFIDCTAGAAAPWSATVSTGTRTVFRKGDVQSTVTATGHDPVYYTDVPAFTSGVVTLVKG